MLDEDQKKFLESLMRDTWSFVNDTCDLVTGIVRSAVAIKVAVRER